MAIVHTFQISDDQKQTILALLRQHLPDQPSWSAVRKMLRGRLVAIGGVLCLDEARRLTVGETVTVSDHPVPPPPSDADVVICHVDEQIIVVEKPSGMVTLRRKSDLNWSWARKNQQPTLDECVPRLVGQHAAEKNKKDRKDTKDD